MENRTNRCIRQTLAASEAFGRAREFFENKYVYAVISARARGLTVGVNINPTAHCTFNCLYCEVDRSHLAMEPRPDFDQMSSELGKMLNFARSPEMKAHPYFNKLPAELVSLKHVAISGNGEPTLCPYFSEAVETIMHVRARNREFYKIVLITNGTGLHLPETQHGLRYFISEDEIWTKLDAGTSEYFKRINGSQVPFQKTLDNILQLASRRPVTIQSLFPSINGAEPPPQEIREYAARLRELSQAGAKIRNVQIYSADRPSRQAVCGHLPLKTLSSIAKTVREVSGLPAEVF